MTLHLEASRVGAHLASVVALLVVATMAGDYPVPSGASLELQLPAGILLPTLAALVLARLLVSPTPDLVTSGIGHPGTRDAMVGLATCAAATATVLGLCVLSSTPGATAGAMARNLVFAWSVAVIGLRVLGGSFFWVPGVAYVLSAMVIGRTETGGSRAWAFVVADAATGRDVVIVGTFLLVAILALIWPRRRLT